MRVTIKQFFFLDATVYPDILFGMVNREFLGHCEHRALGGGVRQLWGGSADAAHEGGGVDDRAAASSPECRHSIFASKEDPFDIDIHSQVPDILFSVLGVAVVSVHDPCTM